MPRFSTWKLKLRMFLAVAILFGILYALLSVIGIYAGIKSPLIYILLALFIVFIQYLISPKIVEMGMNIHYVSPQEAPELHSIVEELARNAGIPKPKVGIAEISIPNAFAFGRSKRDGRVCVTRGILNLLDKEELKAVLGHEISHIRHNDMIVMTFISVVPLICYWIFQSMYWGSLMDRDRGSSLVIIGILAFIAYMIGQLLVLFVSRIREYYADLGSVEIGGKPHKLASALYKLVYGSAVVSKENKEEVNQVSGFKAFFLNDINQAGHEIKDLKQVDMDMNGTISREELERLRYTPVKISLTEKILEIFSTHPNTLKRIKRLSELTTSV